MNLESSVRKTPYLVSVTPPGDPHSFDLEHYRARMAKYLDEGDVRNQIFYDALRFSYELHEGQRRKSGAPYISHPCAVAEILARELQFRDPTLLAAALLHDVVEDVQSVTIEHIESRFGSALAELVDGCTKLTRQHIDRATLKDLTHSKIFLSASRRLGVLIIKLADRLHNLRTLHYLPQAKRQRIAQETVEVYAPIAARFNIFPLKRELYHLALTFLYPRKSKKILQHMRAVRNSPEVLQIENTLRAMLSERHSSFVIRPRAKGLGSYYDHLKRTIDVANSESHIDIAVILQTEDTLECYMTLGLVSTTFSTIPRSLRDFIANPKNSGYRSLHVRIHLGGQNHLIKIRTAEMDDWAACGVLREWEAQKPLSDEHWHEISELLRSIGEYAGAGPQRKALIRLSESDEIFTYSPKGDIYYLPKGSIVLDFAYRIHSEIGEHCEGAFVNNEWSPHTRQLKDGDTVEIFTSTEPPDVDPDVEELCKTPKARTAINRFLHQKRLHYAHDIGRQILIQEITRHGLPESTLEGESIRLIAEFLSLKDVSELFIRLGQDLLSPHLVLYYMESATPPTRREAHIDPSEQLQYERNSLFISELDKAIHKFAKCCNPYPSQKRVLATLSERGITFHHRECRDLHVRHDLEPQQLLAVNWDTEHTWRHPLIFQLHIDQESLAALLPTLSGLPPDIHIAGLYSDRDKHDQPMVRMNVVFKNFEEARVFFTHLPEQRFTIEGYSRSAGPRKTK